MNGKDNFIIAKKFPIKLNDALNVIEASFFISDKNKHKCSFFILMSNIQWPVYRHNSLNIPCLINHSMLFWHDFLYKHIKIKYNVMHINLVK
ncbi:hypothetical protein A0J46_03230 [Photobacterium damselae subsp. damselae]|nr:hypothetical protein A0J46_03230 [Photobacterium damselae subsp. damselae]